LRTVSKIITIKYVMKVAQRLGFIRCRASKAPYFKSLLWQSMVDKPSSRQASASRRWGALNF
jgi:hypothetical protein